MLDDAVDHESSVRWRALRICVCVGLLLGMLVSWRLWLSSGRHFPVLPCFGLGELPAPIDWGLFLSALVLAVAAVVRIWDRWVVAVLVFFLIVLGILDQMRWQPWAYQYLLCLVPMIFVRGVGDRKGVLATLAMVRLLVVATYVWSGIHKFGVQFQRTYESDIVPQLLEATSGWLRDVILLNGRMVPWFEIAIGMLLLFHRTRVVGVWMAVGMHAFILLVLGPFGLGANAVIWPWNIAMAGTVITCFWRFGGQAFAGIFAVKRMRPLVLAVGVLVCGMPLRSISKGWDQYLSFHLYSGQHQRMVLMIYNERVKELDPFYTAMLQPGAARSGEAAEHQELVVTAWALEELGVPMPSEDRILLRVAKSMVEDLDLKTGDRVYRDYPELLEERGFDIYSPVQIEGMSKFPPVSKRGGG